jgi:hypothetical protein
MTRKQKKKGKGKQPARDDMEDNMEDAENAENAEKAIEMEDPDTDEELEVMYTLRLKEAVEENLD